MTHIQLLLVALIALFFVQCNEALPASDTTTENVTYYHCCYYYESGKRGLERRWENKCEEYNKRSLAERNDELEKRWGKPSHYCCYYYYDEDSKKRGLEERSLEQRWDNNCKVYKNSNKRNEKRWAECKPENCCCYEY